MSKPATRIHKKLSVKRQDSSTRDVGLGTSANPQRQVDNSSIFHQSSFTPTDSSTTLLMSENQSAFQPGSCENHQFNHSCCGVEPSLSLCGNAKQQQHHLLQQDMGNMNLSNNETKPQLSSGCHKNHAPAHFNQTMSQHSTSPSSNCCRSLAQPHTPSSQNSTFQLFSCAQTVDEVIPVPACDESAVPCFENGRFSSEAVENSFSKFCTSQKRGHDSDSSTPIDKTETFKRAMADIEAHQKEASGNGELSESTVLHGRKPGKKSIGQRELVNYFAHETLVVVVAALVVVMLGLVMSLAHLQASVKDLEKNMRSAQQCCQRNEERFQDISKELRAAKDFAFANNNNNVLNRLVQYLDEAEENSHSKKTSNQPKVPTKDTKQGENAVSKFPQAQRDYFDTSDGTVTTGSESSERDQMADSGLSVGSREKSHRLTVFGNVDNDEQNGVSINDESFDIGEYIAEDFEEDEENSLEDEDDEDFEETEDVGEDGGKQEQISDASVDEEFHLGPNSRLGSNSDEAAPGQNSWSHSGEPYESSAAPGSLNKDSPPLSRHARETKDLKYTYDTLYQNIMTDVSKTIGEAQKKLNDIDKEQKKLNKQIKGFKRSVKKVGIQSDRFVWNFENSADYQTHLTEDHLNLTECKWLHHSQNTWNTSFSFCRDRTFTLDEDNVSIPFHVETGLTKKKKKHRLVLLSNTPGVFEVQEAGLYLVQFNESILKFEANGVMFGYTNISLGHNSETNECVTIVDETNNHSLAMYLNGNAMLSCHGGGFPCPHTNSVHSKKYRICNIDGLLVLKAMDKIEIRTLQPKTRLRVEDHRMSFMRFVMLESAKKDKKGKKNKKGNKES